MKRRFLSILLSLCLVVGLLPTAAFAQGKSYVALGDSITVGYGLADGEKAFPEIVAEAKGYELTNLAVSGATSQDLLGVVQNSANTAVLANADLITITIGGNDLMGALYQFLADEYNSAKETNISATDVQLALEGENDSISQQTMLTFAAGVISGFAASDAAEEALTKFGQNLNSIIAAIRAANPDVTIIVADQYNPYTFLAEEIASNTILVALGYASMMQAVVDAFDAGLTQLNGAINQGEAMGMYSVAGVYEAFGGATQNPCNASVSMEAMSLNLDFHPNAYGHELIAGVINNLLPEGEEPGGDEEPQSPAESLYVNGVDILAAENHTVTCGSGTAEYDTATNTLSLTNAEITEAYNYHEEYDEYYSYEFTSGIYVEGDLTIVLKGDNTISGDMDYGVYVGGDVKIQGDVLSTQTEDCGLYCRDNLEITNGSVKVSGGSDGIRAESLAITSGSYVTITGVESGISVDTAKIQNSITSVTATGYALYQSSFDSAPTEIGGPSSEVTLISTEGTAAVVQGLSITGGTVTINGYGYYGITSLGPIEISGTPTVTVTGKLNGIWDTSGDLINVNGNLYISDGSTIEIVSGVVIQGLRNEGVAVNGTFLMDSGTVTCGEGTAVYDAVNKTLTLTDATIDTGYTYAGNTCGIYADVPLTIVLEGNNTISGINVGIWSEKELTIQGDGTLTITGDYVGIQIMRGSAFHLEGGTLAINIDFDITSLKEDPSGIRSYAADDDMILSGGSITIEITGGTGIYSSYGNIRIEGDTVVDITSTAPAIFNSSGYTGDLIISGTPTITVTAGEGNPGIDFYSRDIKLNDKVYVCDASTVDIQRGEMITGLRQKGVVVNDVLLSDSSTVKCGEGTAFYNADTNTLILENATIDTGYSYFDDTYGIYADVPLTIILVGENTISGMDYGIYGSGNITIEGNGTIVVSAEEAGIFTRDSLSLNSGTVTATGLGDGSFGIYAGNFTMEEGSALIASGGQAAIIAFYSCSLPDGYLPDGYSLQSDDYTVFTIAKDGSQVIYNYDPTTGTFTLTGAATRVTLTAPAVVDDGKDDDHDTGSTTESQRNPDGSITTTVTKPDGTTVETTRNPDGSKKVVETKKDGTVVTTATDKSGNETMTTRNPDGTSVVAVTRTDGSTSATTVDREGLSVTVAALSDSAIAQGQTGTVSLPMPSVTAASDLDSAPAVMLDLPADTAVKVEIPVENVTAGTVAVLEKADGTSEIVKTSVTTTNGVVLTLSAGETVKIVDNTKTFADVADTFWGADAVAFASSRELFNGTSATAFSPNASMNRAMIVTVLARLDGADTTTGSTWYEAGAQWAVASGISDGSSLDQNLTREQLAAMLYRYAQYKGYDVSVGENTNILSYPDFSAVSEYAVEALQWACGAGIISGKDGLLDPAGSATRAEVATMLMRFCQQSVS